MTDTAPPADAPPDAPPAAPPAPAAPPPITWSSQVTHTAIAVHGPEMFSATYTLGGNQIYALGTVFDVQNGQVNPHGPKRKVELGYHTSEQAARALCESFCRGEVSPLVTTGPTGAEVPPS